MRSETLNRNVQAQMAQGDRILKNLGHELADYQAAGGQCYRYHDGKYCTINPITSSEYSTVQEHQVFHLQEIIDKIWNEEVEPYRNEEQALAYLARRGSQYDPDKIERLKQAIQRCPYQAYLFEPGMLIDQTDGAAKYDINMDIINDYGHPTLLPYRNDYNYITIIPDDLVPYLHTR